ncbi:MAG: AAA family ATPase, partial [Pseudomonadales bacterium]|nr:AAA family ATPase [Pseudomonadales bacterium]
MSEVKDLSTMIASRVPIIVIESHDEVRVLSLIAEIAMRQGAGVMEWSVVRGLERGAVERGPIPASPRFAPPEEALREMARTAGPVLFAFCDLHPYLKDDAALVRLIKEIGLDHERTCNTLILISHHLEIPDEFCRLAARFRMKLPDRDTLLGIVREQAEAWARRNRGARVRTDRNTLDALVNNLTGVTEADARVLIRKAIENDGAITESDIPEINRLKFGLLDSGSVLHFEYDVPDLADVAGLQGLKDWLGERQAVLRGLPTSATEGLDRPKGVMLLGVQGGGKSLAARAIAGEMGLPLLRLDFGNLYNKFVGETER